MNKKLYNRGMIGQWWYNATEVLALALTYRPVPKELEYCKKVSYGSEKNNYMNVFCRKDLADVKKPLFVYIHGGGWISGLMTMRNQYVTKWAQKGFYAASLNYSYAPQKTYPTPIQELFTAIDQICDKAEKDNIDIENIVISGESAGGYYIAYIAACLANAELFDKLGIEFRHKDKVKINSLVSHCGCYDLERLTDKTKPQSKFPDIKMMCTTFAGMLMKELLEHLKTPEGKLMSPQITKNFPRSFLVWGAMDYLRYETFDLSEQLKALGVEHKTYKADGLTSPHAWSIVTMLKKSKNCLKETFDFVLPCLPDYFEKQDNEWKFKSR